MREGVQSMIQAIINQTALINNSLNLYNLYFSTHWKIYVMALSG